MGHTLCGPYLATRLSGTGICAHTGLTDVWGATCYCDGSMMVSTRPPPPGWPSRPRPEELVVPSTADLRPWGGSSGRQDVKLHVRVGYHCDDLRVARQALTRAMAHKQLASQTRAHAHTQPLLLRLVLSSSASQDAYARTAASCAAAFPSRSLRACVTGAAQFPYVVRPNSALPPT